MKNILLLIAMITASYFSQAQMGMMGGGMHFSAPAPAMNTHIPMTAPREPMMPPNNLMFQHPYHHVMYTNVPMIGDVPTAPIEKRKKKKKKAAADEVEPFHS